MDSLSYAVERPFLLFSSVGSLGGYCVGAKMLKVSSVSL
jgi:hypothetical protein